MGDPSSREEKPGETSGDATVQIDHLAERLSVSTVWANRISYSVVLIGVAIGAALMASPGLSSQKIPELKTDDVGKVFRATGMSGFKASRDYQIADEARTTVQREEARARVRPVFDYDPSVQPSVARGIEEAFSTMQALVEQWDADHTPKKPEEGAAAPVVPVVKKKVDPKEKEKEDAELLQLLRDNRKLFEAHALLSEEEDFEALVLARFSRDAARATIGLIDVAYRGKLVTSRDELSRIDASGVTVRIVGGSSEHVTATAAPAVLDIKEAMTELDRFASVPGNLLPDAPALLRRAVLRLSKRQLRANLTVNTAETETRRRAAFDAVKPATITFKKGQKVIGDGELISETHLVVIHSMRAQSDELDMVQLQLGGAGVVMVVILAAWFFHTSAFRRFRPTRKDAVFMGLLLLGMLGLLHLWVTISDAVHDRYASLPIEALYFCFPVAAGAMLVRFVLPQELSIFFAIVFSCLTGVMLGNSLAFTIFALVTSLVASDRISRAKDRSGIFRAGLWTGGTAALAVLFLGQAEGKGIGDTLIAACFAFAGASFAVPMLVMALTPLTEAGFGYASDIKLLELANLNHPALKELVLQAPGTYHHSIIMGSLVEAAAESIGANALLARSCAYYHDIGKGRNPAYFGENQKGENRHDQLAPAMSAVIIKRHVTDGLEMARQYKLPQRVADAIPQHHGTRLVGYFFHKAQKELEGKEGAPPIDESIYRYPGPKPQFREAALCMIADAVEAASRSMPEPTTAKLQTLVQKLINMIFSEGQLDECDLTLKDLNLMSQSFVRTLEGIYHARPAYPPGAIGGGKPPASEIVRTPLALAKPEQAKRAGS
jgi:putative nucleotidyltransferase with HDIG domain